MHEIARRRRAYKARGKNILKSLDKEYFERLGKKLDGKKYGLKKKKRKRKPKKEVVKKKRLVYDKFTRPRKGQKGILISNE